LWFLFIESHVLVDCTGGTGDIIDHYDMLMYSICFGGRRGRDRMVVGFKTTYAIGAYHC